MPNEEINDAENKKDDTKSEEIEYGLFVRLINAFFPDKNTLTQKEGSGKRASTGRRKAVRTKKRPNTNNDKYSKKTLTGLVVGSLVVAIILSLGWFFLFSPYENFNNSSSDNIVAANNKIVPFSSKIIKNTDKNQRALSKDGKKATVPPSFIFNNGVSSSKSDAKPFDIYMDFANTGGRGFILLNQSVLQGLIKSGKIELRIHPVPSRNIVSLYIPEAIAEVFNQSPDKAWGFMLDALKVGLQDEEKGDDAKQLAKRMRDVARDNDIINVDGKSIREGYFVSWILSLTGDKNIPSGSKLPLYYLNDKKVNFDKSSDINSSNDFFKILNGDGK